MKQTTLAGQIALVTGGGIGSAICQRLAAAGATIIINYNSNEAKASRAVSNTQNQQRTCYQANLRPVLLC